MRWISAKKMAALWTAYSKVSKTLEHLGFIKSKKKGLKSVKEHMTTLEKQERLWMIVATRSQLRVGDKGNWRTSNKLIQMNSPWMLESLLPRMNKKFLLIEGIQNKSSKEVASKGVRKNSTLSLMH